MKLRRNLLHVTLLRDKNLPLAEDSSHIDDGAK